MCTVISYLNRSRAKDVYGMDTIFIKTHKEALILPIAKNINQHQKDIQIKEII